MGEGARTTTQGFYSLNSPEFYTQQSMLKKVPVFHHIGGISQSKKKKNFSRIISSCQFLPKKPIYKELSKISQVQELGLSVSILYRHKASLIPWAHTILTGHKSFWAWKWYSFIPSSLALLQDHFYQVILSEILF